MKKILKISLIVIITLAILLFFLTLILNSIYDYNRLKNLELDGKDIVITEEDYLNYLDEIYLYPEKYVGKKIIIEGVYDCIEVDGDKYHFVERFIETEDHNHTDDCSHEETMGIEFETDENIDKGDFIKVTGTLKHLVENDDEYIILTDCVIDTDIPNGASTVK